MFRSWLPFVVLLTLVTVAAADEEETTTKPPSPLTDEDRADLAWLDRLGFPDVRESPFVEVSTGQGIREDDGEVWAPTLRGFLVRTQDDGTFVVWTGELLLRTFRPRASGAPPENQVGWRGIDLAEEVRKRLEGQGQERFAGDGAEEQEHQRFGERLEYCGRTLTLAWVSARRGLETEAHALLAKLRERVGDPARAKCRDSLAEHLLWRAVEAFGDPTISRRELLSALQRFLETFPDVEKHTDTAKEAARILARMVEEDARHDRSPRPIAAMSTDEQIAEWIFRLRDQNGSQMMQPGGPSIFATPGPEGDSPAERLVGFGYEAVPRLIDALDDERFTRTVGFWRDFTYSHYVVRVGGAAASILDAITGRSFEGGQDAWRAWWQDFAKDGITEGLAREVRSGGEGAISAARILVKRSPEKALSAILEGIENAEMEHTHGYLVGILAKVPGESPLAFMQKELRQGPTLFDRLRAARWLAEHGHPEGLRAVTELWKRLQAVPDPDPRMAVPVAIFFVILGTEEAAGLLRDGLAKLPVAVRGEILGRLYVGPTRSEHWPPAEPAADEILLGVLARALEDASEFPTDDSFLRPPDGDTARIQEAAARRLAFIWRDEGVTYTQDAFRADRDRQIRAVINHWRRKQGVIPLPEPQAPDLPQLGNRVRRAKVEPEDTDLGFATTRFLEDLQGEEIDGASFAGLVDAAVRANVAGTRGVEAVLWRPDDGSGVVLVLRFLPIGAAEEVAPEGWDLSEEVRVGRAMKLSQFSGYGGIGALDDLVSELDKGLAKRLDLAVRAVVRVTRSKR